MTKVDRYNEWVAVRLEEIAQLLTLQQANPFRIDAYMRAAETVRGEKRPLDLIARDEGLAGIDNLPGIGHTLARLLFQLVTTGQLPMLDRLRGLVDPVSVLSSVPGVGIKLAKTIHEKLGIDSLEELEVAAYDGRLAGIGRFGQKRIAGIRDSLAARLGRGRRALAEPIADNAPLVSELLSVDEEYREKARAGSLHKITPRRFNELHEAWLPILHTVRGDRHYTALFSNTARAHELHKTSDWVVIYCDTDHDQRQFTVVTPSRGVLAGKRVVRGHEAECYDHYREMFATFVPMRSKTHESVIVHADD